MKFLTSSLLFAALTAASGGAWQQQPPPPPPPPEAPPSQPSSSSSTAAKGKYANHIILSGTVFDESSRIVYGAEVQVRRAGEKKVRAEDVANRAGEFWMHVPGGMAYEIVVKAKGFEDAVMNIDSTSVDRQDLVFKLKPRTKGKK